MYTSSKFLSYLTYMIEKDETIFVLFLFFFFGSGGESTSGIMQI